MTKRPLIASHLVSRRSALARCVVSVTAVLAFLKSTTRADAAKMAQAVAGYQASPKGSQQCDNCTLFEPPNACRLIDGTISPTGWCRFYAKKSG